MEILPYNNLSVNLCDIAYNQKPCSNTVKVYELCLNNLPDEMKKYQHQVLVAFSNERIFLMHTRALHYLTRE